MQYYTARRTKNARVENGHLILEAHREDYEGMRFTSASLHTQGNGDWLYGRIEVRAKLPGGGWGGQKGIDEAIFPQRMEIDYVRVYKPADANARVEFDMGVYDQNDVLLDNIEFLETGVPSSTATVPD